MTEDEYHDEIATALAAAYPPTIDRTTQVSDRVTAIIADFEQEKTRVRTQIRHVTTLAGFALGTALAAAIALVVIR